MYLMKVSLFNHELNLLNDGVGTDTEHLEQFHWLPTARHAIDGHLQNSDVTLAAERTCHCLADTT